ncbi:MAG TPA: HDOD domain-containing protein [Gemmatimonas sp.]|nr:HDOD domain-containing protein [Gemmatimonas sp.]
MIPERNGQTSSAVHDVFIARQPIFDVSDQRVAYELLYRESRNATTSGAVATDVSHSDTALHAVLSIGLDRLTNGALAFVNLTREHLTKDLYRIFEPSSVVLELLETIDGEADVADACARAVRDGYVLALDDYDGRSSLDPLLPYVRIVKLDVLGKTAEELRPQVRRLLDRGLTVLAERVETTEMHALCMKLGCTMFQGYVFSRPETMNPRALTADQEAMLQIVSLLGDPLESDDRVADAMRKYPSLSAALLRTVNAASFGARMTDSIPHAVRLIGRDALSRSVLVMLVTSMGSASPIAGETVAHALVRARFCELLALRSGYGDSSATFLVALLSHLGILLGEPIERLVTRMKLGGDVRHALLHGTGAHARILTIADAYESGQWSVVDANLQAIGADILDLAPLYGEATVWAAERLLG